MNAHLYNPPISYKSKYAPAAYPLLSLPILSAILNKAGIKTRVIDLEAMNKRPRDIAEPFPDIIGLTCMTANRQGVQDMISYLRTKRYSGRIVCGGIYATLYPDEVLGYGCDLVVTGECEGNIVQLLIEGAQGIKAGQPAPIEDIPVPDFMHHEPYITAYHGNMNIIGDRPGIAMWSRGCPNRCIFCENLIFKGHAVRFRPPQNVQASMENLTAYGIKNVFLYDDELVGVKQPDGWMREIADRIEPLGLRMISQGRCSRRFVTPELMADVRRTGIHTIFYGVESMSQPVLDAIKKGITIDDIYHTLEVTHEAGIKNGLYLQVGQYRETERDCKITYNHLRRLNRQGLIDYANVFVNTVMPGTELESIARHEGWYKPVPVGYRGMKDANNDTPWMSKKQIYHWRSEYLEACNSPNLWEHESAKKVCQYA